MKTRLLSTIIITVLAFLLPMQTSAYDFMVNGLCYNKNSDGTTVTVTYQNTSNPRYTSLTGALNIPASVTSSGVTYSVTSIGNQAFQSCKNLTSVTIPNSVTTIGNQTFNGCTGLASITISNSVTTIGSSAFSGCTGLTSLTIPNSVTSIGSQAFNNCESLTSLIVESGNPKYDSRNNCNAIIETGTNKLFAGCKNTIIPNSVTSIGDYAFYGHTGLNSMTIPNSVTTIGLCSFCNCYGLTSVTQRTEDTSGAVDIPPTSSHEEACP